MKTENCIAVAHSVLGWMAIVGAGEVLKQLVFGHASRQSALAALSPALVGAAKPGRWNTALMERLLAYAEGAPVDFADVAVDPGPKSAFQQRVIDECRRLSYGHTATYGQLAARAGAPQAGRAVGNCMAGNRIPLVIPCHRVVAAGRQFGGFSAPGGVSMKKRLLALEAGSVFPAIAGVLG